MNNLQLGFDLGRQSAEPDIAVMISLHEQWHEAALRGDKRYEFRRKFFRRACTAYIYVSGKTRGVAAIAEFDTPILGTPAEIASLGETDRPGSGESLMRYFGVRPIVYAIPISRYTPTPIIGLEALRAASPSFQPPQGYIFLNRQQSLKRVLLESER